MSYPLFPILSWFKLFTRRNQHMCCTYSLCSSMSGTKICSEPKWIFLKNKEIFLRNLKVPCSCLCLSFFPLLFFPFLSFLARSPSFPPHPVCPCVGTRGFKKEELTCILTANQPQSDCVVIATQILRSQNEYSSVTQSTLATARSDWGSVADAAFGQAAGLGWKEPTHSHEKKRLPEALPCSLWCHQPLSVFHPSHLHPQFAPKSTSAKTLLTTYNLHLFLSQIWASKIKQIQSYLKN